VFTKINSQTGALPMTSFIVWIVSCVILIGITIWTQVINALLLPVVLMSMIIIVNKMDRENAHFGRALEAVQQFFGRQAVPIQVPVGGWENVSGNWTVGPGVHMLTLLAGFTMSC
jgi:MFS superfamily sulfate permease-like transporter